MKLVAGLGNPGREYDATRHNVGWWVLDRLAYEWDFGAFESVETALVSQGTLGEIEVLLVKPRTYMNRSGEALRPFVGREGFDVSQDLLVVVDDAALQVGRVRFREKGSAGGHNGLRSVVAALGTGEFSRLRVGVGHPPAEGELVDWVLSAMDEDDEDDIVALLPSLTKAIGLWVREGMEPAMNQFNR